MARAKTKRPRGPRRDRVADHLKAKVVEHFLDVKRGLLELADHVGTEEAMRFGVALIVAAQHGFDERLLGALRK